MTNHRTPKFKTGAAVKMCAPGNRFKYNIVKDCYWDEKLNDYVYEVCEKAPLHIYHAKQLLRAGEREFDIALEHYHDGKADFDEQGWLVDIPRKKKRKKDETN